MVVSDSRINKLHGLWHCSQNKIKINGDLHCLKCRFDSKGIVKRFDNPRSVYYHYTKNHGKNDECPYPDIEYCLSQLQKISEAIQLGVLK